MSIDLMQIFKWGVDYGLLLAERERDSEDLADAFQGVIISEKYSMPSYPCRRRMTHSDEWMQSKLDSLYKAMETIGLQKQRINHE